MRNSIPGSAVKERKASAALVCDGDTPRLREAFQTAGYRDREVAELLGGALSTAATEAQMPALLQRTGGGTPLETLVRLFLLGVSTEVEQTREALQPVELEVWARSGLIEVTDGLVVAKAKILPFKDLLLVCDLSERVSPDLVLGIGASTLALSQIALRGPRESILDLGTGCGFQALLAASDGGRVYGTDRSPRALDFARFNALLNGIDNVEFREGDRFEAVEGEQFDLILCNPPAVISPDATFLWRDSGPEGDGFSEKIVRQAPGFLREGGFFQITCHVAHRRGERWQERVAQWFEGSGCDVWVMQRDTRGCMEYTLAWSTQGADQDSLAERCSRWMAHYEREGIAAISTVFITMRRRNGGKNWVRVDIPGAELVGPCGEAIEQGFAAHDFLIEAADDGVLMESRLRISPHVELFQRWRQGTAGWQLATTRLGRTQGISYPDAINLAVANLIVRCDGKHKLRDLINQLAAARNLDADQTASGALKIVRNLIVRGVLLPSDPSRRANVAAPKEA